MQLTPHDVVNVKLNKGDANSPSLGQGTVYRVKVCTLDLSICSIVAKSISHVSLNPCITMLHCLF